MISCNWEIVIFRPRTNSYRNQFSRSPRRKRGLDLSLAYAAGSDFTSFQFPAVSSWPRHFRGRGARSVSEGWICPWLTLRAPISRLFNFRLYLHGLGIFG